MKFLNTEEMKGKVNKLDQFIEFGVKGLKIEPEILRGKKRRKRAAASNLKAKS